jgi:hypothetical protein
MDMVGLCERHGILDSAAKGEVCHRKALFTVADALLTDIQ